MCTLSWLINEHGYQLFFNRDEQRSRALALAPRVLEIEATRVLMPLDPQGHGSWIAVNENGLSLCLLNYYQGETLEGKLISRGQLVRSLSCLNTIGGLALALDRLCLTEYAPYTLVVFEAQGSRSKITKVRAFQWSGSVLKVFQPVSPLTSSSVRFNEVSRTRHHIYQQLVQDNSVEELQRYHQAHADGKNERSVCMHREDAKTVSFSHITVTAKRAEFYYQAGSPCNSRAAVYLNSIELK